MAQVKINIGDFISKVRDAFVRLGSRDYEVPQQHFHFQQALEEVDKALEELKNAWRKEVINAQKKAQEQYTGRFRTYEEAIPTLKKDYPLFFANCVFTKHWYSRDIGIAFPPVSDEIAYKIASAWLIDGLAK